MAALVPFQPDTPVHTVIVPRGPSCSTFITYPAGMTENAPKNTALMGPQDPTQNHTLPPHMMAIGIPPQSPEKWRKPGCVIHHHKAERGISPPEDASATRHRGIMIPGAPSPDPAE